jgi:predicted RNA binding protein YcfA (HicA-like mRNA interferase family)
MPRKLRELKSDLRRSGFVPEPGKGSHVVWRHHGSAARVTLSGGDGDDAKPYQEREVRKALARAWQAELDRRKR